MRSALFILLLMLVVKAVQAERCPYECLCDFISKTADCSEKFKRYPPDDLSTEISSLLLHKNYIDDLTPKYFHSFHLTHLTRLDVSNNLIKIIHANAFYCMDKLSYLNLERNQIYFLVGDSFAGLTNLEGLYLDNNLLGTLYEGFFHDLGKVKTLTLRNNQVGYIQPKSFRGMHSLTLLDLSGNCLSTFGTGFLQGTQHSLEVLALNNNSLENIEPGAFKNMSNLFFLSLGNNVIEELDGSQLEGLTGLEYLYMYDNMIEIIKKGYFEKLPKLKYLDLIANYIFYINPQAFASNRKLKQLHLSRNTGLHLQSEIPFINSSSLQILKLSGCRVRELTPEEFRYTPNLKALAVDHTFMSTIMIEALQQLKNLRYLSIQGNPLTCTCSLQKVRQWCRNHSINTSWFTEDFEFNTFERRFEPSCYFPKQDVVMNWELLNCTRTP